MYTSQSSLLMTLAVLSTTRANPLNSQRAPSPQVAVSYNNSVFGANPFEIHPTQSQHGNIGPAPEAYGLVASYDSSNFFDSFSFYNSPDPTSGDVNYYSQSEAQNLGIISTNGGQVYLGVDWTNNYPSGGRPSVRVASNIQFTQGLFIADIAHMPASICGVWPAFWTVNSNWPTNGEIDIIEGVNTNTLDTITLHTSAGCNVNIQGSNSGTSLSSTNCNDNNAYNGCSASTTADYGTNFNNDNGGVYAMQWASSGIYVWFWPRNQIPSDISDGQPDTTQWGTPYVAFNGGDGCDIDSHFVDHSIIFNIDFCGTWAGAVFDSNPTCASLASSCDDYVNYNPGAFQEAYWLINSVKVYQ